MHVLTRVELDRLAQAAAMLAGKGTSGWNWLLRLTSVKQLAGFFVARHMAQVLLLAPTGQPVLARSLAAIMPDTKPLELPCEM
jgi:hypothetical protein